MNGLLDYAMAGKKGSTFHPVDLNNVVDDVSAALSIFVDECDASITVGELPTMEGIEVLLRQLLQNLVGNALKYRRAQAPPVIAVEGGLCEDGETCQLTVTDNGIGIDHEFADAIFAPYRRLVTNSQVKGSGVAAWPRLVESWTRTPENFRPRGRWEKVPPSPPLSRLLAAVVSLPKKEPPARQRSIGSIHLGVDSAARHPNRFPRSALMSLNVPP
ncbi:MAG: hypothetical protein HRU17_04490 [Polyangiaceae bacterium]|nr:hypothetical protein [Polyangiaceae bacterium]